MLDYLMGQNTRAAGLFQVEIKTDHEAVWMTSDLGRLVAVDRFWEDRGILQPSSVIINVSLPYAGVVSFGKQGPGQSGNCHQEAFGSWIEPVLLQDASHQPYWNEESRRQVI